MTAFAAGLVLGLTLIVPIGAQNAYVLHNGLLLGARVLPVVVAAALCDSLLILLGAAGAHAVVDEVPVLRPLLLLIGAGFLAVLGVRSLRSHPEELDRRERGGTPVRAVRDAVAVSLLNPHAILDTVGIIGGAVASQAAAVRPIYAAGAITASWTWFALLGYGASAFQGALTARVRRSMDRVTGTVMLLLAGALFLELWP